MKAITNWLASFANTDLYETGYAEVFRISGAATAETREDLIKGLAYSKGYADAARDACDVAGHVDQSRVNNRVSATLGMLLACIDDSDDVHASIIRGFAQ